MGYLGKAYKEAGVQVGDKAAVMTSSNEKEYIIVIITPEEALKNTNNISGNAEYYVYGKIIEVFDAHLKIGHCDGWNSEFVKPLSYENKTDSLLNNCPECNIQGEYINGAFKCPKCWKIW